MKITPFWDVIHGAVETYNDLEEPASSPDYTVSIPEDHNLHISIFVHAVTYL
jgi:hypothetical protein